jgi:hypothetical protein
MGGIVSSMLPSISGSSKAENLLPGSSFFFFYGASFLGEGGGVGFSPLNAGSI